MSITVETLCLHRVARMPYLLLPTAPQCKVTYVWINPSGSAPKAKTRTLDFEPQCLQDVPRWYGTYCINLITYEVTLVPVQMFRDPFMLDPHKLILCDVWELNGTPAPGNRRVECMEAMEAVKDHNPWFGFEQEYVLQTLDKKLFGWTNPEPPPTGASAQVGLIKVFGRDVSMSHYSACLYAGVKIAGTTGESMPAQWEFQVGPSGGLELGDHAWMARYILHRVCEDFGLFPSFNPVPMDFPRWGNGGHMNFSTESMRAEGGIEHIHRAIERLAQRHAEHMEVYGSEDNRKRLNNVGVNSDFDVFSWSTAERKCSVRIPGHVSQAGRGYLEDRRPAADCDPYLVCKALVQTCILPPGAEPLEEQTCILPPGVEPLEEQTCILPPGVEPLEEQTCILPPGVEPLEEQTCILPPGVEPLEEQVLQCTI